MNIEYSQKQVLSWATATFGDAAKNPIERASRLIEEALELVQAEGLPQSTVNKIVEHVYGRAAGCSETESADVFITLLALCENRGIPLETAFLRRFRQISQPEFGDTLLESQDRKAVAGIGVRVR